MFVLICIHLECVLYIQIWNDYRLRWNPEEYGGVTMLHMPAELIWLPDIILYNKCVYTIRLC